MGFRPKHAIPLSSITVCGGSVANLFVNLRKRHPLADRPIVDWDLVFAVEPLGLVGALIGTFLNKITPEGFLGLILILFLGTISHITFKRALKMYYKESHRILNDMVVTSSAYSAQMHSQTNYIEVTEVNTRTNSRNVISPTNDIEILAKPSSLFTMHTEQERQKVVNLEPQIIRPSSLIFGTTMIVVLFINIMKGGEAFPSPLGFGCGSPEFWCANLLMIIWLLIVYLHARVYLASKAEQHASIGFAYSDGDIHWDSSSIIIFPFVSGLSGFFAGMFGIGGGIIKVRRNFLIIDTAHT